MTMLEKVARAICENKPDRDGYWESVPEARRKGYRTMARAAIEAMREPTVAMVNAWEDATQTDQSFEWARRNLPPVGTWDEANWEFEASYCVGNWQAMIDAALSEDKQ